MSDDSENIAKLQAEVFELKTHVRKLEEIAIVSAQTEAMIAHILTNHSSAIGSLSEHVNQIIQMLDKLASRKAE